MAAPTLGSVYAACEVFDMTQMGDAFAQASGQLAFRKPERLVMNITHLGEAFGSTAN